MSLGSSLSRKDMSARSSHYHVFTSARGIAALWVMLLHFSVMVSQYSNEITEQFFQFGSSRVYFFFVISGFFMMHIYEKKLNSPNANPFSFFKKRASRIYPLWWCALFIMSLEVIVSESRQLPDIDNIIKQIALIKPDINENGEGRILGVSWTLEFEIMFYVAFSLLFLTKNKIQKNTAIILGGAILFYFESTFALFLAGMAAAKFLQLNPKLKVAYFSPAFVILALIIYSETFTLSLHAEKAIFAMLFFSLLIYLALWERAKEHNIHTPRILKLTGRYSYSIYLFHIPVGTVILKIFLTLNIPNIINGYATLLALFSTTWLSCLLIGEFVEKPIGKFMRGKF